MNPWPDSFGLGADHCTDVLQGCYDLPYEATRCLDIGANVGAFARWANTRWPGVVTYSYEPHPGNFALLQKSIDYFKLPHALAYQTAVADGDDEMTLHENGNCGEWSLIKFGKGDGQIKVQVMDAAKLPDADFIKIDTEGAEPNILKRLLDTHKLDYVNAVVLEYHAAVHVIPLIWQCYEAGLKLHSVTPIMDHRGILKFLR